MALEINDLQSSKCRHIHVPRVSRRSPGGHCRIRDDRIANFAHRFRWMSTHYSRSPAPPEIRGRYIELDDREFGIPSPKTVPEILIVQLMRITRIPAEP